MMLASRFAVPVPHVDDNYDPNTDNINGFQKVPDAFYPGMNTRDFKHPTRQATPFLEPLTQPKDGLTTRESVELFQEAVDNATQGLQQALAGSETVGEATKPKLTVDLARRNLNKIPSEVVAIIKQDVERLQLAHNRLYDISYDFTRCSTLKYLNLRDNRFKEVPKAIFGLPQIEILDLSRNKLSEIPEEIDKLKALRVFSIMHNNIENLPFGLGNINTLRMLKVAGNPLNPRLRRMMEEIYDAPLSPSTPLIVREDPEKETRLTSRITDYLRAQAAARDSADDSYSDGPLETPRAQSRFPVQPHKYTHSTSGSESASDLRSPSIMKPPLPTRSHYRVPSTQNNLLQSTSLRRSGLAPLALGNERNRSNSESIIQATQNNKNKRMGIVTKKHPDLGVLDETQTHRNSHHFRGQSHGSALRNGTRPSDDSSSNGGSPGLSQQGTVARQMSSLPEDKQLAVSTDKIIEGAKGVLYSLHLVHPRLSTLVACVKNDKSKRSSFQRVFHSAGMHLDHLDTELHRFEKSSRQSRNFANGPSKKSVCQATNACIATYQQIGNILLQNIEQLVRDGDQRYIRTLMLMLYGSLNEARNARRSLPASLQPGNYKAQFYTARLVPAITAVSREPESTTDRVTSITPTRERPKPERRWRNGSIVQQSINHNSSISRSSSTTRSNSNATLSAQSAVSLRFNGRSRSHSKAAALASTPSSSVASTPRSGESFSSALFTTRFRAGSLATSPATEPPSHNLIEKEQSDQFERIFITLIRATKEGLSVIPFLEPRFQSCQQVSKEVYAPTRVRELWAILVNRVRSCADYSEQLKKRLSALTLNDPEARNAPDFWRLAKRFVNSYSNLLVSLREARSMDLVDNDIRLKMKPVHKTTVEAAHLMAKSPWSVLTSEIEPRSNLRSRSATPMLNGYPHPSPTPSSTNGYLAHPSPAQHGDQHHMYLRTNHSGGLSPYQPNMPATPLSAALGPAAQATVSSTPASANLDRMFQGDFFQRADSYQSMQQTVLRRHGP